MRLIRSQSYRRMPWKNGGGETIEIAVHPPEAFTSDFDWRVSMAKVEGDGPFSAFPDIDRTLTILEGQGIALSVDGGEPVGITDAPHSFPGDRPASARLLDGPVTDLNVMTRRGRHTHRVTPIALKGAKDIMMMAPVVLLYCHHGRATVEEEFVASMPLEQGDTLLIDGMPNGLSLSAAEPSRFYLIEISPVRQA